MSKVLNESNNVCTYVVINNWYFLYHQFFSGNLVKM